MRIPRLAAIGAAAAAVLVASGTALAFTTGADHSAPPTGIVTAADSTTFPTDAPSPPNAPQPPAPPAPSAPSAPVAPAAGNLSLSPDEAAGIALAHVGSGQVTQIEREVENGQPEWKVEITAGGSQHEVRVNAQTGAITRTDGDNNGDGNGGSNSGGSDNGGSGNGGTSNHHGSDDNGGSNHHGSDDNGDNNGDDGGS
jgi:Peptidase propeptide and YPEB domain